MWWKFGRLFCVVVVVLCVGDMGSAEDRPNFLLITVDDMSADSVGIFGCPVPDTTPHIDALARSGRRYDRAHVQVGNCYPSRNVLWSGLYPHRSGVEGFYQVPDADHAHLVDVMKSAGYFVAIRGKVSHSTPYQPYAWDADLTRIDGKEMDKKDPRSYGRSVTHGITLAKESGKPFCINVNISDPHKPFYARDGRGRAVDDPYHPSRTFTTDEMVVPGFLFEDDIVRSELVDYYNSVRRADDCVGEVMRALAESGVENKTCVSFLSDHGMPLPFAKTMLYHHSTRTPWIVRYPGITEPGSIDSEHMISAVDWMPTMVDMLGMKPPNPMDGKSFASTLRGEHVDGFDDVFKVYAENSGGHRHPMRAVQDRRYLYIFNPWSLADRPFKTATTGTATYRQLVTRAKSEPALADRLDTFLNARLEQLYDIENDPDALHDLIDRPDMQATAERMRERMADYMRRTDDPLLEVLRRRDDVGLVIAAMDAQQAASDQRRSRIRRAKSVTAVPKMEVIELSVDSKISESRTLTATVRHTLPPDLSKQRLFVTLKDAAGKRVERQELRIAGAGEKKVVFVVPSNTGGDHFRVAAFVGDSYDRHLQHVISEKIAAN